MAVAITSVVGLNGNPPATIRVSGTASGCERIGIKLSCAKELVTIDLPSGTSNWSHDFPNELRCACKTPVRVDVTCEDNQGTGTASQSKDLECGECPNIAGTTTVGQCDQNGNRPVDFTLNFSPAIPQGAIAQVVYSYGGPNAQGQTTSISTLPTANGAVSTFTHSTLLPPRAPSGSPNACSYFANAAISIFIDGQLCPLAPVDFCVNVLSCLPCPGDAARNRPPVSVQVTVPRRLCAPAGAGQSVALAATVNFPAGTANAPSPSGFDWAITTPGNGVFIRRTATGSTTTAGNASAGWRLNGVGQQRAVDLSQAGAYTVSVTALFPPGAGLPADANGVTSCNLTGGDSFVLDACRGAATCPSISNLTATPDCADPAAGRSANWTFTVTANDPSGLISGFDWNFGDPASGAANQTTTTTPTASHSYAGTGSFTVTVAARTTGACNGGGPTTATTLASVALCPCPAGQRRNANGQCVDLPPSRESFGCMVLRQLVAGFFALSLVAVLAAFCLFLPPGIPFWVTIGVAAGLAVAALIMLLIWLVLPCPRPCAWGLLLAGQILFGTGWGCVYFFFCCPWLGIVGLGALAAGSGLLAFWMSECRATWCRLMHELAWVLTVVVAPVISVILLLPQAAACVASLPAQIMVAILTFIAAGIVGAALACSDP